MKRWRRFENKQGFDWVHDGWSYIESWPMHSRVIVLLVALVASVHVGLSQPAQDSEAAKKESMFQNYLRKLKDQMAQWPTNESPDTNIITFVNSPEGESMFRALFDADWIHSSFGMSWDEVPPPTVHGAEAVEPIARFIATNGWWMHSKKDGPLSKPLGLGVLDAECKPLRGLPWIAIRDREFKAITDRSILYVPLRHGPVLYCSGVAYNPQTNRFPKEIVNFKHIGDHWYVWEQSEHSRGIERYEGGEAALGPEGGAYGSQPIRSETYRASSAAGPGRSP